MLLALDSIRLRCPPLMQGDGYYENGYKTQSILGTFLRCVMNIDVPTYNQRYNLEMVSAFSCHHQHRLLCKYTVWLFRSHIQEN